ncbi:MAG: hypothetical protein RL071_2008 [Pseudomonadota bacterium]
MIAAALLLVGQAWAIDGNDRLQVVLSTGEQVEGWFYRYEDGQLVLSGEGRLVSVWEGALGSVVRNGAPMSRDALHLELIAAEARVRAAAAGPTPHPAAVTAASVAWAGAGPALLGDRRQAIWLSVAEAALLTGAAYGAFSAESWNVIVPMVGVDVALHGWAARDARRRALTLRRRQAGLSAERPDGALQILHLGPRAPAAPRAAGPAPSGADAPPPVDKITP